jgi:hypothetical protein
MTRAFRSATKWLRENIRTIVRVLGLTLGIAGAVLVISQIWIARDDLTAAVTNTRVAVYLGMACAVYAASRLLVFSAWFSLLNGVSPAHLGLFPGLYISAVNTLLKYLPGNVAQHAWRAAYLHQRGFDATSIVWSSVMAAGCLSAAAALIVLVFGGQMALELQERITSFQIVSTGAAVLAVAGIAVWLAWKVPQLRTRLLRLSTRRTALSVLTAIGADLVFFLVNGALLFIVARAMVGDAAHFGPTLVAFAGSWIAGFLMPGAPAGLGVRETLMIVVLTQTSTLTGGEAALIAVIARVISLIGDPVFALPVLASIRRPS